MGTADGTVLRTKKIVDNGPDTERWNLVILAEGFQASELRDFELQVHYFMRTFQGIAPFARLWPAINIHRVNIASVDSGPDEPGTCGDGSTAIPKFRRTYLDSSFCGDGTKRRALLGNSRLALATAKASVPNSHAVLVIVNSSVHGGAARDSVGWTSTHPDWANTAIHEICHSAFALGDEYVENLGRYPRSGSSEPAWPNVTAQATRSKLKWAPLVLHSTKLPTFDNTYCPSPNLDPSPVAADTIGLFEGADHYACGVYRPQFTCKMRNSADDLCVVCQRRIYQVLAPFGGPNMFWDTIGNGGTNPATHFIGTTDQQPLYLRTNGKDRVALGGQGHVNIMTGVTVGAGGNATLHSRHVDGKNDSSDTPGPLLLNWSNGQPVKVGSSSARADFSISGSVVVGAEGGNTNLVVRHVEGKDHRGDSAGGLHLNWYSGQPVYIGSPTARSEFHAAGNAIVGAGGGNTSLRVRHVDGKDGPTDNLGGLHLNWSSGQPVWIGNALQPASLQVSGDTVVGSGRDAVLYTRHISGKHHQSNNPDALFLNAASRQPVVVGQTAAPSQLQVFGTTMMSTATSTAWPVRCENATVGSGGFGALLATANCDTGTIAATNSGQGCAIAGVTTNTGLRSFGVLGIAGSTPLPAVSVVGGGGVGVVGVGGAAGVAGASKGQGNLGNIGVDGLVEGSASVSAGVRGQATGAAAVAVIGQHFAGGTAGRFIGRLDVVGSCTASCKQFRIDHPDHPAEKYLNHASVESSEILVVYSGNATTDKNGDATIGLPKYVAALARDFRYQLTVIGEFAQAIVAREIEGNEFAIRTSKPNVKVSWQVSGVRNDPYAVANPMIVEQDKAADERGRYLHPELYEKPQGGAFSRPIGWLHGGLQISKEPFVVPGLESGPSQ